MHPPRRANSRQLAGMGNSKHLSGHPHPSPLRTSAKDKARGDHEARASPAWEEKVRHACICLPAPGGSSSRRKASRRSKDHACSIPTHTHDVVPLAIPHARDARPISVRSREKYSDRRSDANPLPRLPSRAARAQPRRLSSYRQRTALTFSTVMTSWRSLSPDPSCTCRAPGSTNRRTSCNAVPAANARREGQRPDPRGSFSSPPLPFRHHNWRD